MTDVQQIRTAIMQALPIETFNSGELPDANHLYIPPAHVKALRLEEHVVMGARGVGKSLWTAALGSAELRKALGGSLSALERVDAHIGFSSREDVSAYPNADIFSQFLEKKLSVYHLWRGVMARWIAKEICQEPIPSASWEETYQWLTGHPEALAQLMNNASQLLARNNRIGLFIFDALDRSCHDWRAMDEIVRELLRAMLWLKSYPHLTSKVFLREDQLARPNVINFPDASKLLANKASLTWAKHDLHGLLWQILINAPAAHGECLRQVYQQVVGTMPIAVEYGWRLPEEIKREGSMQQALFEALAGKWMGKDRRRGVPYIWSVSHLADGQGRTSPRSFLAAIRQAAEDSAELYPSYDKALHYQSIKRGVQKAAEIRNMEIAEDYPWVSGYLAPLKGLTLPIAFTKIQDRWQQLGIQIGSAMLPPQHIDRGAEGVSEELMRLGLFTRKNDGRIDMPDLYRVGFGLGRLGGVKPNI